MIRRRQCQQILKNGKSEVKSNKGPVKCKMPLDEDNKCPIHGKQQT